MKVKSFKSPSTQKRAELRLEGCFHINLLKMESLSALIKTDFKGWAYE